MERQTQTTDIQKWSALVVEAVNKPGLIMKAYRAFWNYSVGNQILALVQCQLRGIQAGPINTFPKWQTLGRVVKRGERALTLAHHAQATGRGFRRRARIHDVCSSRTMVRSESDDRQRT